MKIRVKQRVKQNDGPDGALILCEMENIEFVEINGIRYVPPAPEPVRRWECEAILAVDPCNSKNVAEPFVYNASAGMGNWGVARAKLGFDAQGRVWMADERAQWLGAELRKIIGGAFVGDMAIAKLREAADRLAGPEQ